MAPDRSRPPADVESPAGQVASIVAFLAELAMVGILAVTGARLGDTTAVKVCLGVLLPVAAAVAWSIWMAPRSSRRLEDPARLIAQILLFAVTAALAIAAGLAVVGIVFFGVAVAAFAATRIAD